MSGFRLQIVTPQGVLYDDMVKQVVARTIDGDVGILKNHIDYTAPVENGRVKIYGKEFIVTGDCSNGFVHVMPEVTRIISREFVWIEE